MDVGLPFDITVFQLKQPIHYQLIRIITRHALIEFKFYHFFLLAVNFLIFLFDFNFVFFLFLLKLIFLFLQFFNLKKLFGNLCNLCLILCIINFLGWSSVACRIFRWLLFFLRRFCFNCLQKFIIFVSIQN